jgi:hypothetical protein
MLAEDAPDDTENLEDFVVAGVETRIKEINSLVRRFEDKTHILRTQVLEAEQSGKPVAVAKADDKHEKKH